MSAEQVESGRPKGMKVRMANGQKTPDVHAGGIFAGHCLQSAWFKEEHEQT